MIIFHVHKCSIRVSLTIIISSLKAGCMPVVSYLTFLKFSEKLKVFLVFTFSFPSAIHKNCSILLALIFKISCYCLKILNPRVYFYRKRLHEFMVLEHYCFLDFLKHLFFPFANRFFPDKCILVGTCFQFRTINKYRFYWQFSSIFQSTNHLIKQIFTCLQKKTCPEPGNRAVIWCLLTGKQPHKVNIS